MLHVRFGSKADLIASNWNVRFVPQADMANIKHVQVAWAACPSRLVYAVFQLDNLSCLCPDAGPAAPSHEGALGVCELGQLASIAREEIRRILPFLAWRSMDTAEKQ